MVEPDPYLYMWEFRVPEEDVARFVELYGPSGAWVRLFEGAGGYLGTELLVDRDDSNRFVSIDRWGSKADFDRFRAERANEFEHLDTLGERLTTSEKQLGQFRLINR